MPDSHPSRGRGRRPRRSRRAGVALAGLPLLAGCGAGFDDAALQPYTPGVGVNDRSEAVYALALVTVTDGEGAGTLVGTLVNQDDEPDALVGVAYVTEAGEPIAAELIEEVPLLPGQPVQLHEIPAVAVEGDALRPGFFELVVLQFARSDEVELQVPTEPATGEYADVDILGGVA